MAHGRMSAAPDAANDARGGAGTDDVARQAGRGGLAVAAAKAYFIVIGLVQQIALPQIVGAAGYGALSRVLGMASVAYNPIVSASIQGLSRAVAQAPEAEQAAAVRRAYGVHAVLALVAAAGFYFVAPVVARATGAPHVVGALHILAGVMLFYGLYAPLIGVLNGRRRFLHQAGLDMLAGTLRTAGLVGGAVALGSRVGGRVEGASLGFVVASATVCSLALVLVGTGKRGAGGPSARAHVTFLAPLLFGQVLLNLLLQADLQLVGYFASQAAQATGRPLTDADPLVGAYRATQLFSFLPYQLLISVTFILFPMLASAARDGDRAAAARYVRTGVRLAILLAGLMVSVTCGLSGPLLRLVFPKTGFDALASGAMQVLTLGFGVFALFGILTTVLTSLGRETASMVLTALAVLLVITTSFLLVPGTPFGRDILLRTAMSTTAGLLAATLATAVLVRRTAGAVVAPLSIARAALGLAAAIGVSRLLPPPGKIGTLIDAALLAAIYLVVLLVTGEVGRADLESVRTVLSRRRRA